MLLGVELGKLTADSLVVNDAAAGMQQIETERFTGVICDGLEGAWTTLWGRSRDLDIGFVLFSGSEAEVDRAEQQGVHAFSKSKASPELYRNMFGLLLPQ